MKKKVIILPFAFILCISAVAQNVGVGTNTPAQKLDVAGNINTTGNLMVNGVAGVNGQVLGMNGGSMQWMDKSRFKNWSIFTSSGSFTVPAGITEVLIEMWGAGGGGHFPGGGGGSGGYWSGLIPVSGISSISLTVGTGGSFGTGSTAGANGGNTGFVCTGFNVFTGGGSGADSTKSASFETYSSGGGGLPFVNPVTIPSGFRNFFYAQGNTGIATTVRMVETAGGVFNRLYTLGVGGVAPFSGLLQSPAPSILEGSVQFRSSGAASQTEFGCGSGPTPGGGGFSGGPGRIIIYY